MLKTITKTQPDWHFPFNDNAAVIEDKLTLKASCTYDTSANAYTVQLINVPANDQNGDAYIYPDCLPDLFSVVTMFPNKYEADAVFVIGSVEFAPKYAAFEAGDVQQINFDKVNRACFFTTGGSSGGDDDEMFQRSINHLYNGVDLTIKFASEIAAPPYNGDPWAWIKARKTAGNFAGLYIGDYIPFTAGGNVIKAEIAGIDTYYNYGDTAVGHHIDFISRDCWPDVHVFNKANYNNGTSVSPYPWLASDLYAYINSLAMQVPNATTATPALVAVDYSTTGIYDKLPAALKNVIITKRLLMPQRYTAGSLLVNDNAGGWVDAGKLWIPSEIEVYGLEHWGSKNGYSSYGYQQYAIFTNNMKRIKGAGDGGVRANWWLSSPYGGNSSYFAFVTNGGHGNNTSASSGSFRVPVCFRI